MTVSLVACKGTPVDSALITDFSDALPVTDGRGQPAVAIGTNDASVQLGGGSFTYSAPGLSPPVLSLEQRGDGHALRVTATPGTPNSWGNAWSGFGLGLSPSVGNCIDASEYTGVAFTLEGSLSTCQLLFGIDFSQDNSVTDNPMGGSCAAGGACTPPLSGVLIPDPSGLVKVPFGAVSGGLPLSRVDTTTITAVQWQLVAPLDRSAPCVANFVIVDVAFFQ